MFYRSAADHKLASLEARIARLENRISKRAYEKSTIEYMKGSSTLFRLGVGLGIRHLDKHSISDGNSIQFDQSVIEGTDGVALDMITEINSTHIEIRLARGFGRNLEFKSFIVKWNPLTEIHPTGLASEIKQKAMMFDLL